MKVTFRLDEQITDGQRAVYWNDALSYHADEDELQDLLNQARLGRWKSDQQDGISFGSRLFQLLDRSGGQLTRALREADAKGEGLYLYLDLPFEIDALPFELLYHQRFLLLKSNFHLIHRVNDRNRLQKKEAVKRELKLLFMAASPLDLPAAVLQFEKEEELILKATERFPVNIRVEDSGSLQGIEDALYEGEGYDIIHLSGHANIEPGVGPVFYFEDELGELAKVTPDQLWESVQHFAPHILFLSGCMTGKSDKLNVTESFSRQMVEKGIPLVLGWGLPVSDEGATLLAAKVYELLAIG